MLVDVTLPVVGGMVSDPIPNIRFNVAKTLGSIVPHLLPSHKKVVEDQIKTFLEKMVQDSDQDVRYYAKQSLASESSFL